MTLKTAYEILEEYSTCVDFMDKKYPRKSEVMDALQFVMDECRVPTEEEVCDEIRTCLLSSVGPDYLEGIDPEEFFVRYDKEKQLFYLGIERLAHIEYVDSINLEKDVRLPGHIIASIGKFYTGKERKGTDND